jgi:hypothetical protein
MLVIIFELFVTIKLCQTIKFLLPHKMFLVLFCKKLFKLLLVDKYYDHPVFSVYFPTYAEKWKLANNLYNYYGLIKVY